MVNEKLQQDFMRMPEHKRREIVVSEVESLRRSHGAADWKNTYEWLNNFQTYFDWPEEQQSLYDRRKLKKEQLPKLFQDMDRIIRELNLQEKIITAGNYFFEYLAHDPFQSEERRNEYMRRYNALHDILLPVYIEMRVKGYHHDDITR